ncbi:MAG: hypothetical protein ACXQS3_04435 [Candidatus Methanofastidiosia archaeon]
MINEDDYINLPKKEIAEAKISFDSKHYLLRIPRKIELLLDIKKGDKFRFIVDYEDLSDCRFEIIKGEAVGS